MKIQIKADNVWAFLDAQDERVEKLLRYKVKGARFSKKYADGFWDGFVNVFRRHHGGTEIPIGLVPFVRSRFPDIEIEDTRPSPDYRLPMPERQVELDESQDRAVREALKHHAGIIQYPTGVGKGRIIGELTRQLALRTLIICDRKDVFFQLVKQLRESTGMLVGIIGAGNVPERGTVTVATFQALSTQLGEANFDLFKQWDVVIVDEVQHVVAETYANVLKQLKSASWRYGFSATPFKAGDHETRLKVQAWIGPVIAEMSQTEGVETGRIVPVDLFVVHGCGYGSLGRTAGYPEEVYHGITHNELLTRDIVALVRGLWPEPTVIIVDKLEQGEYLRESIYKNGHRARTGLPPIFVHGGTPQKDRVTAYNGFRAGIDHYTPLILSKIGDEGLDLPNIANVILAGGGAAVHRQVQRIGRGQRASEGKSSVTVFDFEHYGEHIGAHYRKRRKGYAKEPNYTLIDIEREEIWDMLGK